MSRNVTILTIILAILLIAGYLLWLRGRFQSAQLPVSVSNQNQGTEVIQPTMAQSASGTATYLEATAATTASSVATSSSKKAR